MLYFLDKHPDPSLQIGVTLGYEELVTRHSCFEAESHRRGDLEQPAPQQGGSGRSLDCFGLIERQLLWGEAHDNYAQAPQLQGCSTAMIVGRSVVIE
jgi:hypothetical protein